MAVEMEELSERLAALEEKLARSEAEREEYRKLYLLLREENEKLKAGLIGQKAERLPPDERQLSLSMLEMLLGNKGDGAQVAAQIQAEAKRQTVPAHERRKPRRKPLPEHLPRVDVEIIPLDVQHEGLDKFERIDSEVTEYLERRPSSCVIVAVARPKFVRKDRPRDGPTRILISETPDLPIERGLAGPGMLADTIVRRWQDHQPTNRLEGIYRREGVDVARSTICGWHGQLAELTRPVIDAMFADTLAQPVLCTDATGVLVQAKEKCRTGHFWVLVAPDRHVLFRYSRRHNGEAVDELLPGYEGYLVADAHSVYDHLYVDGTVIEVGCWAHCRRYLHKSLGSEPKRALEGMALIGALFKIERAISGAPRKQRLAERREKSAPIVDAFFSWCDELEDEVVDQTPLAQAVGYARNQRKALSRFLDDPRLPLHNNMSELQLRRQVLGRRNWLFLGTDEAAVANTTFVSLLASCAMHGIEPWRYLRDLFCLLPSWPHRRALELAPAFWKKTLEDTDTQKRLESHPLRAAMIALDLHPDAD